MNKNSGQVYFKYAYGTIPIVIGILTAIIFSMGAIILNQPSYWLYLLLSVGLFFMGLNRIKKPYLVYSENEIMVNGIFGRPLYNYQITARKNLKVVNNNFYLNEVKLKFNNWFVNQSQYNLMIKFFTGDGVIEQHLL